MSLGVITWTISGGRVAKTSINLTVAGRPTPAFTNLTSHFDQLSVSCEDCEVKAWLHIQDGKDFYQQLYPGEDEGKRLSDKFTFCQEQLFHKEKDEYLPILHVSAWEMAGSRPDFVFFPRYSSVMDSSIWNYYWCTNENKEVKGRHLKWIIESIATNKQNGVYNLAIAREYADLNARLVHESYIASKLNGHGMQISPFLFHSEWEMEERVKKMELKDYHWRILLIDDYAWRSMNAHITPDGKSLVPKNSKMDVLKRTISAMGFTVECVRKTEKEVTREGGDAQIEIWGAESIKEAFQLLSDKEIGEFDIILLDYLLGSHSMEDPFGEEFRSKSPREYGYEFLKRLEEKGAHGNLFSQETKAGLAGKHYIMFISAFTTAVGERLRSEGLSRNTERWYIAEGACPTNTPSLFKYYLANIMERRISELGIDSLKEDTILNEATSIYCVPDKTDIPKVRKRAYQSYRKILGFHYDYFTLKEYQEKSLLVASFMKENPRLGAMLEHLLQLVHLTAFGTVLQWPEMWEEYQYVTRTIGLDNKSEILKQFSKNVADYIITLKSS